MRPPPIPTRSVSEGPKPVPRLRFGLVLNISFLAAIANCFARRGSADLAVQRFVRRARTGPPTLWHQRQLLEDPLSPLLDGRPVQISSGFLKFRRRSRPPWDFRFFVISSYLTTTNTREAGLVLTLLNHFHLFPSCPLVQIAEGSQRGHLLCSTE